MPVSLISLLFFFFYLISPSFISNPDPKIQMRYAESITAANLHKHVAVLAADSLEGRETGKKGQKMAADYIKNQFIEIGLEPSVPSEEGDSLSFYQKFNLIKSTWKDVYVKVNNEKIKNFEGIIRYGKKDVPEEFSSDIVFVGNGSEKEIDAVTVKGKAVLFLSFEPYTWAKKVDYAKSKGATAFFVVNSATEEEFQIQSDNLKHYLDEPKIGFSPQASGETVIFYTAPSTAGKVFRQKFEKLEASIKEAEALEKFDYKIKPSKISYKARLAFEEVETENVLGFLKGSDLSDELIVITAHYDHIGMNEKEIFNGADDDASGTSAVIEIADAFVRAKKEGRGARRSILFMAVTGEEKGLLGSLHYTNNPVFPLEKTIANLNIDMIGRLDKDHEDNPDYVYLIGSDKLSTELHQISEEMNKTFVNLELDYRYNDDKDPNRFYYRSDHYNFAKNDIPVIFYFNGTHEDYHQATDTIEKINFEKIEKISRLIFHTAWEVANRPERLALKAEKKE